MVDLPKKDILSIIFCDILGENCSNPEILCSKCPVLINSK